MRRCLRPDKKSVLEGGGGRGGTQLFFKILRFIFWIPGAVFSGTIYQTYGPELFVAKAEEEELSLL